MMLEHFLFKKLHNRNVVTLSVLSSPIPTPFHANLPLLEAMLQVGRLLIAYLWDPSLLPSLHLRTRTWFFLTQTWSLKIKTKVTWGWVRWVRWMFQHGDLVLRQKLLDRQGVVCRCLVLVKNPWAVFPHFRSSSSHPFTKVCQNLLVVDLVNGLTFRHPIHVNNPSDVGKKNDHQFFNPLNPELNPICYLLALLGTHHFPHVSRIRVKLLTLRRLMSYVYGAPILDVSRSHTTTQHSR